MSEIFESTPLAQPAAPENKFAIPVRYGLMVGFISMFLTTITFLYILKWNFWAFSAFGFFMFVIPVLFYFITTRRQRLAYGGVILLKDAFQAAFIVIVISQLISTVYGLIYTRYIDPECFVRMKEQMLAAFEKMGSMPQQSIDEQMDRMDKTIEDSTKTSVLLFSLAKSIVLHSIFGFIAALVSSRKKPIVQP